VYVLLRFASFGIGALIAFGLFASVVSGLRSGKITISSGTLLRAKNPVLFWIAASAHAAFGAVMASILIYYGINWARELGHRATGTALGTTATSIAKALANTIAFIDSLRPRGREQSDRGDMEPWYYLHGQSVSQSFQATHQQYSS
jgi:hypothetical protein